MAETCPFCRRGWANSQALRAHLKGCASYAAHKAARTGKALANTGIPRDAHDSLGNETDDTVSFEGRVQPEKPFDEVQHLRQQVTAGRLRLQLREVEDAQAERDRLGEAKERERQQQAEQKAAAERMAARDRENAQRLAEDKRRERERREAAENQLRQRRREIIQAVKHQVVERWVAPILGRADLKARALQDIERELAELPVEELPHGELVLIAEGVRDRIYRAALDAERVSQERAARRQQLIQHGCDYASTELREAEGIPLTEIWTIERRVREELTGIEGDETAADIEDWVDEILDDEGIVWDDDDA